MSQMRVSLLFSYYDLPALKIDFTAQSSYDVIALYRRHLKSQHLRK